MKNGSEKYIEAIKFLGELYDFLNRRFFFDELEKPVITVCPDGKNKAFGWFICGEIWREDGEEKPLEILMIGYPIFFKKAMLLQTVFLSNGKISERLRAI